MTASERFLAYWTVITSYFSSLTPTLIAINLALSAGTIILCWGAVKLLEWLFVKVLCHMPEGADTKRLAKGSRALGLSRLIVRIGFGIAALVLVSGIWGIDIVQGLTQGVGLGVTRTLVRATVLVVLSVAAIEAADFFINFTIDKFKHNAHDPRRAAQLGTLGPIIRNGVQTAIIVIVAIMMLSQIGIQVGPLLAGAGVLGLAVGFGAQTLVKDFLTGFFLIVEDIVAVGDIIRIGDSGGQVEEMTLRTIRLRDFDGTLHVFPYSEAQVVHNLTKTFSYYVFDLQISHGSSVDKALEIMRVTGAELQNDADFTASILEPIEVVGVDSLKDSGIVLKARIKTLPIHQWRVGREYNRRIKQAFDAEGIEIPYPHMKVILPNASSGADLGQVEGLA